MVDDVARMVIDGREVGLKGAHDAGPYREGERQRGVIVGTTPTEALIIERL